ncbi:type III-B CRISPR module-associated protein Cmr5 [Oleidesulfovibrio alaskensis]
MSMHRASYADLCIKKCDPTVFDRYVALLKGFPTALYTLGMGQALAYLREKGGPEYGILYGDIARWILTDAPSSYFEKSKVAEKEEKSKSNGENEADLLCVIFKSSQEEYIAAQEEILELLYWMKKLAVIAQKVQQNNNEAGQKDGQ